MRTEQDFINHINSTHETVEIMNAQLSPASILRECAPDYYQELLEYYLEYGFITEYECEHCGEIHDSEDNALNCCYIQEQIDYDDSYTMYEYQQNYGYSLAGSSIY